MTASRRCLAMACESPFAPSAAAAVCLSWKAPARIRRESPPGAICPPGLPMGRAGQGKGRMRRPRHAPGRWARLRRGGQATPPAGYAEIFARQLLLRWGVVFRDVAAREPVAPPWRELLGALRRLESRGEIRGGRFVEAYLGEQFALPEALDLLRAIGRSAEAAIAPAAREQGTDLVEGMFFGQRPDASRASHS